MHEWKISLKQKYESMQEGSTHEHNISTLHVKKTVCVFWPVEMFLRTTGFWSWRVTLWRRWTAGEHRSCVPEFIQKRLLWVTLGITEPLMMTGLMTCSLLLLLLSTEYSCQFLLLHSFVRWKVKVLVNPRTSPWILSWREKWRPSVAWWTPTWPLLANASVTLCPNPLCTSWSIMWVNRCPL